MNLVRYSENEILKLFENFNYVTTDDGNDILDDGEMRPSSTSDSFHENVSNAGDILSSIKEIAKEEIANIVPSMYNLQMFDIDYRLGVSIEKIDCVDAKDSRNISDDGKKYGMGYNFGLTFTEGQSFSKFGNFPYERTQGEQTILRRDYNLRTPSFSAINRQINILQATLGKSLGLPFVYQTEWDLSYYFSEEGMGKWKSVNGTPKYNLFYRLKSDNPNGYTDDRMLSEASVNCAADLSYQFSTKIYDPTFASVCPNRYVTRLSPKYVKWPVNSFTTDESELAKYGSTDGALLIPETGGRAPNGLWMSPKKVNIAHYFGINQSHVNAINKNPNPITKMLFYDMYRAKLSGWENLFLKFYKQFYFSEGMSISGDKENLLKSTPFRLPEIAGSMASIVANDGAEGDVEEENGLDASDEARSANASLSMGSGLKGCIKGVKSAFKFLRAMNKMGMSFKKIKVPDTENDNGSGGSAAASASDNNSTVPDANQASHNPEDYKLANGGEIEPYDTLSNGVNHFSPMMYGGPVGTITPTSILSYTSRLRIYRGNFTDECYEHFELDDIDNSVNPYLKIDNVERWCGWYNSWDTHSYANNWCRGPSDLNSIDSNTSIGGYPEWWTGKYELRRIIRCWWGCWWHNYWTIVYVPYRVATSYGHFCANHPHFRYIHREYRYSNYVTLVGVDVTSSVRLKLTITWNWRNFWSFFFGGGSPIDIRWKLVGTVSRSKRTLCALNTSGYNGNSFNKNTINEKEPNSLINQLGRDYSVIGRVPELAYSDKVHDSYCEFGMWFSYSDFIRLNSSMNSTLNVIAKTYGNLIIAKPTYRNNQSNYSLLLKNKKYNRFLNISEWVDLVKYQLDNLNGRLDMLKITAIDLQNNEIKDYMKVLYDIYVPTQVKLASYLNNDSTQDGFNPFLIKRDLDRYLGNYYTQDAIGNEVANLQSCISQWKKDLDKICELWKNAKSVNTTNYYANFAKTYFVSNIMRRLTMQELKVVSAIMIPLNILYEARQYFSSYRFNRVDGTYYSMALLDSIKSDMLVSGGLSNTGAQNKATEVEKELGKLPIAFYEFNHGPGEIVDAALKNKEINVAIKKAYIKCEYVTKTYYDKHPDKALLITREYKVNSNNEETETLERYIKKPEDRSYIIESKKRQAELNELKNKGEPLSNAKICRIIKDIVWDGQNTPIVFGRLGGLDIKAIKEVDATMSDDIFNSICGSSEITDYWEIDYETGDTQDEDSRIAEGLETDAWIRPYDPPESTSLLLEPSPIDSNDELV